MRTLIFSAGLLILFCLDANAQEDPVEAAEVAGAAPSGAIDTVQRISQQLDNVARQVAQSLNTSERVEIATRLDILHHKLSLMQGDKQGSVTDALGFALGGPGISETRYRDIQDSADTAIETISSIQAEIGKLPQLVRIDSGMMETGIVRLLSYKRGLLNHILETQPPFEAGALDELRRVNQELQAVDTTIGRLMQKIATFRSTIYDGPIDIRCGPGEVAVETPVANPTAQAAVSLECHKLDENVVIEWMRRNPAAVGSVVGVAALLIGIFIVYRRRQRAA